jgi:hypothetical protein
LPKFNPRIDRQRAIAKFPFTACSRRQAELGGREKRFLFTPTAGIERHHRSTVTANSDMRCAMEKSGSPQFIGLFGNGSDAHNPNSDKKFLLL